jgi:hypothetical protein
VKVVVGERRLLGAGPQHLEPELAGRRDVQVAGVVHHHVDQHPDAARVGRVDERLQVRRRAEALIEHGVIERVVAVIGVVLELLVTAHDPAVDLLVRRGDPQRVDPELVEPARGDLRGQPAQIAAVERPDVVLRRGLALPAVAAIVARIAVGEPIGHHEVDDGVVGEAAAPRERISGGGAAGGGGYRSSRLRRAGRGRAPAAGAERGACQDRCGACEERRGEVRCASRMAMHGGAASHGPLRADTGLRGRISEGLSFSSHCRPASRVRKGHS